MKNFFIELAYSLGAAAMLFCCAWAVLAFAVWDVAPLGWGGARFLFAVAFVLTWKKWGSATNKPPLDEDERPPLPTGDDTETAPRSGDGRHL